MECGATTPYSFYRSIDFKEITSIGVIEDYSWVEDINELIKMIGKRSVYSIKELERLITSPLLVVNFLLCNHFKSKPNYQKLLSEGIVSGPIQSIMEIPEARYLKLKSLIN